MLRELKLKLTAVFEPAPEGGYRCHFEQLPEVLSEGETLDDAKANLWDAVTEVIEYRREEARKNIEAKVRAIPGVNRVESHLKVRNP